VDPENLCRCLLHFLRATARRSVIRSSPPRPKGGGWSPPTRWTGPPPRFLYQSASG
jgi:hypothetical protein